jgi:peptidoglycan/xylan/chitin deacetylase (PgdA/CDA1 family)
MRFHDIHPLTLRGRLRHRALDASALLNRLGGRRDRSLAVPRVQILYLHYLFDDEVQPFRRLLSILSQSHAFLRYSQAVETIRRGPIDRPAVAFTFDDGFDSCRRAADILAEFGASACFFVCPGLIDLTDADALARISRDVFHLPPMTFMDWDQLSTLKSQGHEIGNHTLTHENLARTDKPLDEQIGESADRIRQRLGGCEHFAWPYGRPDAITPAALSAIRRAGHVSIASGIRGSYTAPEPDDAPLRRDHVIAAWPVDHTLYFLSRSARLGR